MIDYFMMVLPLLWPHLFLIVSIAWLAARTRTLLQSVTIAVALAILATFVYWAIQNGVAPDGTSPIPGQMLALLIASALPLVGAALASFLIKKRNPAAAAIAIGIGVGLGLLVPMPTLQVALGCAFTAICP